MTAIFFVVLSAFALWAVVATRAELDRLRRHYQAGSEV
jgi:hypothetical protein